MKETVPDIYDYPEYYDLVYGYDWKDELNFLLRCFRRCALRRVKRVFEPACGTGRLLFRLARAGFIVSGLDLNDKSVRYCNQRLRRNGFPESVFVGDMSSFELPHHIDAAFNMINSFRHLITEQAARDHLRRIADALSDGGIYVIGLHVTPTEGGAIRESWSGKRGPLSVTARVRTTRRDARRRDERCRMTYLVETPRSKLQLSAEMVWRTYKLAEFYKLIRQVPELEITDIFDFKLDEPIVPNAETSDAVFVLRRRSRSH